jgi:hypothetical protein
VLSYVVLFLLLPLPLLSSVAVISRRMPTGKRKCVLWRSVCYWLSCLVSGKRYTVSLA